MNESPTIRNARRRYVTVCVLFWLPSGLAIAPLVLLLTERGMTLAAIAGAFAAFSLTVAVLELPTGGLSDVLGRRGVLAAAGLLNSVALTLQAVGGTPLVLTLGMVLLGAGRALSSGPAEAWYVDTVRAHGGSDAELRTGLARGSSATSAALATGTLLGGALPWLLGPGPGIGGRLEEVTSGRVLPLSVPLLLGVAVEIAFVLHVLSALDEPPRSKAALHDVLRGIPVAIVGALRMGGRHVLVRRVMLSAAAAGSAVAAIELLSPGRAATLAGGSESGAVTFALLACAGFVCSGIGSHIAPWAVSASGSGERTVLIGLGTGVSGMLLLGVTAASGGVIATTLAALGYGLVYFGLGVAGPSGNELMHRKVMSSGRASALSVQSLAQQAAGALVGMAVGLLRPGPLPWMLACAVLFLGTLLWVRRSEPAVPRPGSLPGRANAGPETVAERA
ncbi:MFS transporter [Streptomyces sp. NPDC059176]|uniref:MFS transporter n=1 Tax=unclassified Streptomyces TaxID=2593676 RepID=UPI003682D2A7